MEVNGSDRCLYSLIRIVYWHKAPNSKACPYSVLYLSTKLKLIQSLVVSDNVSLCSNFVHYFLKTFNFVICNFWLKGFIFHIFPQIFLLSTF